MYRGLKDPKTVSSIQNARHKKRTSPSLSDSNVSDKSFVDVEGIVSPRLVKPTVKKADLLKCPCNKSDPKSWRLTCTKCKQQWHTNCANLCDISKEFVETLNQWLCPSCFVPCSPEC